MMRNKGKIITQPDKINTKSPATVSTEAVRSVFCGEAAWKADTHCQQTGAWVAHYLFIRHAVA